MKTFNQKVYEVVRLIPEGMVLNYGSIACIVGSPTASRAVGYALHGVSDSHNLPWHRVVLKDGSLPPFVGEPNLQYKLLKAEGVSFTEDKKVDMKKHLCNAAELEFMLYNFL